MPVARTVGWAARPAPGTGGLAVCEVRRPTLFGARLEARPALWTLRARAHAPRRAGALHTSGAGGPYMPAKAGERFIAATSMHAPTPLAMIVGRIQPLVRLKRARESRIEVLRVDADMRQRRCAGPTRLPPSTCPSGASVKPGQRRAQRMGRDREGNDGDRNKYRNVHRHRDGE